MENKEVKRDLSEASQQEMLLKERKANSAWRKLRRNKSAMFGLILVQAMRQYVKNAQNLVNVLICILKAATSTEAGSKALF